ncbi:MAG: glycosyltransferase family 2 protein [Okeania sp. SIO3C4]|nr:glycosyltransferase family 2 protein [Okeania sp. SIO3C4]
MITHSPLETPVVLIIFKRVDATQKVFNVIRQMQPKKLLVVADGPRLDREGEAEKCQQTRAIVDQVDWDCEVLRCFSEQNLGCGVRISTGLSWVFEHVEEAIILEDDCLPHPTFFTFCSEMLEYYRDEPKVMSVSGCLFARSPNPQSYYFSHYLSCWGWATWRRAWQQFDFEMTKLPELLDQGWLHQYLPSQKIADFWERRFRAVYESERGDVWYYQFQFASWVHDALSIRANTNLIANIGMDADATHTQGKSSSQLPSFDYLEAMSFPLHHPQEIQRDVEMDAAMGRILLDNPNLVTRAYRKLKALIA